MEDVITLVNGRDTLVEEIAHSPAPLRRHLAKAVAGLLEDRRFLDALAGHLGYGEADQERIGTVLARLRGIARQAQAT